MSSFPSDDLGYEVLGIWDGKSSSLELASPGSTEFEDAKLDIHINLEASCYPQVTPNSTPASAPNYPTFALNDITMWEDTHCSASPHTWSEGFNDCRIHTPYDTDGWDIPVRLSSSSWTESSGPEGDLNNYSSDILINQPTFEPFPEVSVDGIHTPTEWFIVSPMSRTESVFSATTVSSFGSIPEDQPDTFVMEDDLQNEESSTRFFNDNIGGFPTRSKQSERSGRTVSTRRRGRTGPLRPDIRASAATMRTMGACASCKRRKQKCDTGIPCAACIRYWKGSLIHHPCRGRQLYNLADAILGDNTFPKGRPLERFLGSGYGIGSKEYTVSLNFGFGAPLACKVKLVRIKSEEGSSEALQHKHVVYPWPPGKHDTVKRLSHDYVFPAILSDLANLESEVDLHLTWLLEEPANFKWFPLWDSKLKVLRGIYIYYKKLRDPLKKPLREALKLLILVHIGGDLSIEPDPVSRSIVKNFLPACIDPKDATPCFIRGQLGPIFSKIAHTLMRDVLTQLEILSPSGDCSRFPVILSTFSVLFMAVESLQYHVAKESYHSHYDHPDERSVDSPTTRDLDEWEGAEILRKFYKATFPLCHAQFAKLGEGVPVPLSWTNNGLERDSTDFFNTLIDAIEAAREYLMQKSDVSIVPANDMSCFFDRLLAKFYLMET